MLTGHEADVLYLELADDVLELGKALPAHLGIVGRMRQVAGEDNEVWLFRQAVYGGNGFFQRSLRIGVRRTFEAPMRVRQLDEIEVIGCPSLGSGHCARGARSAQTRGEHHAAQPR